jgi:hypothetical protein
MAKDAASESLLKALEAGVRAVLRDQAAKPSEKVAAIAAGAKLLMIKHRISESDESTFFK